MARDPDKNRGVFSKQHLLPNCHPNTRYVYLLSFTIQSRQIHILYLGMIPSHFGYTSIIIHGMCNSCPTDSTVNRPFFCHLDQYCMPSPCFYQNGLTHVPLPIHNDEYLSYHYQPNLHIVFQGILLPR